MTSPKLFKMDIMQKPFLKGAEGRRMSLEEAEVYMYVMCISLSCAHTSPASPPHRAMQFLQECSLLKIEDILPFFPDFVTIDHFKVMSCDCHMMCHMMHHMIPLHPGCYMHITD